MENSSPHDFFTPFLNNDTLAGPFLLMARIFAAAIFVFYIFIEIVDPSQMRAFLDRARLPGDLIYLALAVQIVGIAMVVLGYKTQYAALALGGFCIVATLLVNAGVKISLLKDFGIAGGFLFMAAYGAGPLAIDAHGGRTQPARNSALDSDAVLGPLLLVGRIFAAAPFLFFGNFKIFHNAQMQAYMVKNNPAVPVLLIYPALILQLAAGTMLILGYKTRWAALSLSGFCILATVLYHNQFAKQTEVIQFLTDFTLAGVLLFLFAYGPGPLSLDVRHDRGKLAHQRGGAAPQRA